VTPPPRKQRSAGGAGLLVVISGPSGVGKGAIVAGAGDRLPGLRRAVSATTRAPRAGEVEGKSYYFKSHDEFRRLRDAGELLEWAQYLDDYYGTPRREAERDLAAGETLVFEVDVKGARSIRGLYPEAVLVFAAPPTWEALAARLGARQSETGDALTRRLEVARAELECAEEYDYVIINDRLADAVDLFRAIVRAEHARPQRVDLNRLRADASRAKRTP